MSEAMNFVNAFERMQVISDIRPHGFSAIGMHFSNAIAIIGLCPIMLGMANCWMFSNDVIV